MPLIWNSDWPARCGRRWIKLQVCSASWLHDSLRKIPSVGIDFFERDRTFKAGVETTMDRSIMHAPLQSCRFIARFYAPGKICTEWTDLTMCPIVIPVVQSSDEHLDRKINPLCNWIRSRCVRREREQLVRGVSWQIPLFSDGLEAIERSSRKTISDIKDPACSIP